MSTIVDKKQKECTRHGKVLLIPIESKYNVLSYATELFCEGFRRNGYEAKILNLHVTHTMGELDELISREYSGAHDFIFSINGGVSELKSMDQRMYLCDSLSSKSFSYFVDHPQYHSMRLQRMKQDNFYVSFVDKNHVSYTSRYYHNVEHISFLPHFGFLNPRLIPYEERKIDLFFPGSYYGTKKAEQTICNMPEVYRNMAHTLIHMQLENHYLTLESALKQYLLDIHFEYEDDEFIELLDYMAPVDQYIREFYREKVVESILEAGITLTVTGSGWKALKEKYQDRLHILTEDGMDIKEVVATIADSKMVLNVLPFFKCGTHERILTAMMNGVISVTDENEYLLDTFQDGENILFYNMKRLEALPQKITYILEHETAAMKIIENARKIALEEYSFERLAGKIIDMLEDKSTE